MAPDCWTGRTTKTDRPLIFIGIHKNAGSSILQALGLTKTKFYKDLLEDNPIILCVIRNPMTRIVSAYKEALRLRSGREPSSRQFYQLEHHTQASFDAFLADLDFTNPWDPHYRPQMEYIKEIAPPTHILRFETIDEDFRRFCDEHYEDYIDLPHANPSVPGSYQIDEDRMRLWYAEDFKL